MNDIAFFTYDGHTVRLTTTDDGYALTTSQIGVGSYSQSHHTTEEAYAAFVVQVSRLLCL